MRLAHDVQADYGWVLTPDRPALLPTPSRGPLRIAWLVNSVEAASGGNLGMLRVIHYLEQWGHQNRIYIVGRTPLSPEDATRMARSYFPIHAYVEPFLGTIADSDALIATLWRTAYVARGISNTARKFYFVQDLEYLFYAPGGLSEFAKETYRWGFYGITLGEWIRCALRREFNMESSAIGFTYDRALHSAEGSRRLPSGRKRVLFYARPSTERRAFELGVLALSIVAQKRNDIEFVLLGWPLRPDDLPFPAILPGVVPRAELPSWYRSCTVALVLSYTNLSLLPLELMACGCAVVSNSGPNVESFLNDKIVQLAESNPSALAGAILALLENDKLCADKIAAAMVFAQGNHEENEMRKFESALYRGLGMPPACASAEPVIEEAINGSREEPAFGN